MIFVKNSYLLLVFLTVWQLLFSCQTVAKEHYTEEMYESFVQSILLEKNFKRSRELLITHFLKLINSEGIEKFKSERNRLATKMMAIPYKNHRTPYLIQIDKEILLSYFFRLAKKLETLPDDHPAVILLRKTIEENNTVNMKVRFFSPFLRSKSYRGLYYYNEHSIAIDFVEDDSFLLLLVHELTHYFDSESRDIRHYESKLDEQFGFLDEADLFDSKLELKTGRYWFLKEGYLKYKYHEILANHNACLVVEDLTIQGVTLKLSKSDQKYYKKILKGQLTCDDFIIQKVYKNRDAGFSPDFLWPTNDWRYRALTKYRKKWLKENGFKKAVYKF